MPSRDKGALAVVFVLLCVGALVALSVCPDRRDGCAGASIVARLRSVARVGTAAARPVARTAAAPVTLSPTLDVLLPAVDSSPPSATWRLANASVQPPANASAVPLALAPGAAVPPPAFRYRRTTAVPAPSAAPATCAASVDWNTHLPSNCPDEGEYVRRWATLRGGTATAKSAPRDWTVVYVGANKGYGVAAILSALGVPGLTPESMGVSAYSYMVKTDQHGAGKWLCGACCDCAEAALPSSASGPWAASRVVFHAFEAMPVNAAFVASHFGRALSQPAARAPGAPRVDFRLYQAAAGAADSRVRWTLSPILGFEGGKLGSKPKKAHHTIANVSALDSALAAVVDAGKRADGDSAKQSSHRNAGEPRSTVAAAAAAADDGLVGSDGFVDVLLTDTEGHDFYVADGARGLLDAGRVGLYVFEIHGKDRPLHAHIKRLDAAGYRCFFPLRLRGEGNRGKSPSRTLLEIGGTCWQPAFEVKGWLNVVCGNTRVPSLIEALEVMSAQEDPPPPRPDSSVSCVIPGLPAGHPNKGAAARCCNFYAKHAEELRDWRVQF